MRPVLTGPNAIPASLVWGMVICGGRTVTTEAAKTTGDPQTLGAQLQVEETRGEVDEARRQPGNLCEWGAGGADKSNNPGDEAAVAPWWREARRQADLNKDAILCRVGTTADLRVDEAGSQAELLLDTRASRSFINPQTVELLQLKTRRPSEEGMLTVGNCEQMRIDHAFMLSKTVCERECSTGDL